LHPLAIYTTTAYQISSTPHLTNEQFNSLNVQFFVPLRQLAHSLVIHTLLGRGYSLTNIYDHTVNLRQILTLAHMLHENKKKHLIILSCPSLLDTFVQDCRFFRTDHAYVFLRHGPKTLDLQDRHAPKSLLKIVYVRSSADGERMVLDPVENPTQY